MSDEKPKKVQKISDDSALEQVDVLLDYYGIDKADIELEDGPAAVQTLLNTLKRAVIKGNLEISLVGDADLQIIHHLAKPIGETASIIYSDKIGNANLAMDSVSSKKPEMKKLMFMAALSDASHVVLQKLKAFDQMVFARLSQVFSLV